MHDIDSVTARDQEDSDKILMDRIKRKSDEYFQAYKDKHAAYAEKHDYAKRSIDDEQFRLSFKGVLYYHNCIDGLEVSELPCIACGGDINPLSPGFIGSAVDNDPPRHGSCRVCSKDIDLGEQLCESCEDDRYPGARKIHVPF